MIFPTRVNQEPTRQVILWGLRPSRPPLSDTQTNTSPTRTHVPAVPCEGGRQPPIVLKLCSVSEFTSIGCGASEYFPENLWKQRCDERDEERNVKSVRLSVLTIRTLPLDETGTAVVVRGHPQIWCCWDDNILLADSLWFSAVTRRQLWSCGGSNNVGSAEVWLLLRWPFPLQPLRRRK